MLVLRAVTVFIFVNFLHSQDPESLLDVGKLQLSSGEFVAAESSFNSALQVDPSFAPALQALSKLYLHKGDLKTANKYAIQAVEKDEDFREWSKKIAKITEHVQNGTRNVQERKYDEAIIEYDAISKEHPYFSEAEFYKGLTKFRQKDLEGAAGYFSNALSIYPKHIKARKGLDNVTKQFLNAGNKAHKMKDVSKAISYYEKALEYDPMFYLSYFQLGILQKKQGQSKKAIESLNKVLEINNEHEKTWFTLGGVYESDGNIDEAIKHYNKAIDLNPRYSKAYGNLGKLYTERDEYKLAEDILKTVTQIDKSYADGFMRLGLLYMKQNKFELAADQLLEATNLDTKDHNKFFNLASSYNQLQKWDLAVSAAQSCIDLKRKFGGGWLELGLAELGRKNKPRAKKHFEEARKDRDWRKMAERKIDEINNPAKYEK